MLAAARRCRWVRAGAQDATLAHARARPGGRCVCVAEERERGGAGCLVAWLLGRLARQWEGGPCGALGRPPTATTAAVSARSTSVVCDSGLPDVAASQLAAGTQSVSQTAVVRCPENLRLRARVPYHVEAGPPAQSRPRCRSTAPVPEFLNLTEAQRSTTPPPAVPHPTRSSHAAVAPSASPSLRAQLCFCRRRRRLRALALARPAAPCSQVRARARLQHVVHLDRRCCRFGGAPRSPRQLKLAAVRRRPAIFARSCSRTARREAGHVPACA
jgi:hypothetical protein